MDELKFLLINNSTLTEEDIQLIKQHLKKQKISNSLVQFLLVLVFGLPSLLWILGFGIEGTELLFNKLELNITPKTRKVLEIISFWVIPLLWGLVGTLFLNKIENRKRKLSKLSEKLSERFGYNFRIRYKD